MLRQPVFSQIEDDVSKPRIKVKAGSRPMGNVVVLSVDTCLDIPAERVLLAATERGMRSCLVIGYDNDGEEYFASSLACGQKALWLLERAKTCLLAEKSNDGPPPPADDQPDDSQVLPFPRRDP